MDLGPRHREPPGRACQAPQQQWSQHGHDHTEQTAGSERVAGTQGREVKMAAPAGSSAAVGPEKRGPDVPRT